MKDASLHPESDMIIEAEEWRQTIMSWGTDPGKSNVMINKKTRKVQ